MTELMGNAALGEAPYGYAYLQPSIHLEILSQENLRRSRQPPGQGQNPSLEKSSL